MKTILYTRERYLILTHFKAGRREGKEEEMYNCCVTFLLKSGGFVAVVLIRKVNDLDFKNGKP